MLPPIVLIVYNRPELTRRAIERLRAVRPARVLVVADGPKSGKPGDEEAVRATRDALAGIDWECAVERNEADANLGCFRRVASGLDWAFARADRAIVLEDDCLADDSFFPYAAELLERYAAEPRVMAVAGNNFQRGRLRGDASYYFSRFNHLWGWASWRRAWERFDAGMADWPERRRDGWLRSVWPEDPRARAYWTDIFDRTHRGEVDSWGYRWTYACWKHGGVTALPQVNLVRNIGFGADATHTRGGFNPARAAMALSFPLRHPARIEADAAADAFTQSRLFTPTFGRRLIRRFLKK